MFCWIYTTVNSFILCYAAIVWCHGAKLQKTKASLVHLKYIAYLGVSGVIKMTPRGLPPLDSFIERSEQSECRLYDYGAFREQVVFNKILKEASIRIPFLRSSGHYIPECVTEALVITLYDW